MSDQDVTASSDFPGGDIATKFGAEGIRRRKAEELVDRVACLMFAIALVSSSEEAAKRVSEFIGFPFYTTIIIPVLDLVCIHHNANVCARERFQTSPYSSHQAEIISGSS